MNIETLDLLREALALHPAVQGQDVCRQILRQGHRRQGKPRFAGRGAGAAASGRHSHLRDSRRRQAIDRTRGKARRRANGDRRPSRDRRRHAGTGEDDLSRKDQHRDTLGRCATAASTPSGCRVSTAASSTP